MSTVKITDLPQIATINANTANTVLVGVDIPTNITGQITLTSLARGLYANNSLIVGNNHTLLANVVAQFTGNSEIYSQVNTENINPIGSADFVVTADDGTETDYYLDMGLNNSTYSDPAYSATKAHDGYLYVAASGAGKGNLAIGTTNSTGRVNFVVGGLETENIVGYIDSTGIWSGAINSVVSANAASANSVINTRISANVATLRGEITANTDSTLLAINSRITSNIFTANLFTQSAFNKANSAIANTVGVKTAGTMEITDRLTVNGSTVMANANFASNEAALSIIAGPYEHRQIPSNDGYMLHISGKQDTPSRIVFDSFGAGAYGLVAGRSARGTSQTPTATQNNDVLMRMTGNGWGTTGFAPLGVARIDIVAAENYTDAARGSKILFYNIPIGTNTVQNIATFNGDTMHFSGYVYPEKGFVYAPRVFAGAQTAITVDFANDTLLRANVEANYAISFTNFISGKQTEVWLTNTSGSQRTFTHGCSELNSTTNSLTYNHPATSTIVAKYMCFDGDTANVLVQIVHA